MQESRQKSLIKINPVRNSRGILRFTRKWLREITRAVERRGIISNGIKQKKRLAAAGRKQDSLIGVVFWGLSVRKGMASIRTFRASILGALAWGIGILYHCLNNGTKGGGGKVVKMRKKFLKKSLNLKISILENDIGFKKAVARGDYTKIGVGAVMALSIMALFFYKVPWGLGVQYPFTQSSWAGSGSTSTYINGTGGPPSTPWTNYESKVSDVVFSPAAGGDLELKFNPSSFTHTDGSTGASGFSQSTPVHNNTTLIGSSGEGISIAITQETIGDPPTFPSSPPPGTVRSVDFSPNDKYFAAAHSGSNDGLSTFTFNAANGSIPWRFLPPSQPSGSVNAVAVSPNSKFVAVGHGSSPRLTVYKVNETTGQFLSSSGPFVPGSLPLGGVNDVAFSADGKFLAVTYNFSPYFSVYNFNQDEAITNPIGSKLSSPTLSSACNTIAFSSDSMFLAVGCNTSSGTNALRIYEFNSATPAIGSLITYNMTTQGSIASLAFHPDGRHLAACHGGAPRLSVGHINYSSSWNIISADDLGDLDPGTCNSVAFSPEGRMLSIGYNASPYLASYRYDTTTHQFVDQTIDLNPVLPATGTGLGGNGNSVDYSSGISSSNRYILAGYSTTSPYIKVYKRNLTFAADGTFTSGVIDLTTAQSFRQLNYNADIPSSTSLTIKVRAGDTNPITSSWATFANGADLTSLGVHRYVQYQAIFTSNAPSNNLSPILNDITISYGRYSATGMLTSSAYNAGDVSSAFYRLHWNENKPTSTRVKFQLRTAPGNTVNASGIPTDWSSWMGPRGTSTTYFQSGDGCCSKVGTEVTAETSIPTALKDGLNDKWFQYRVILDSVDGGSTSTLNDVTVVYAINSRPAVTGLLPLQSTKDPYPTGMSGTVRIAYQLKDEDANNNSFAVGLFYDVGLKLLSNISSGDSAVSVDSDLSLSALLPPDGVILIDNEQIKYWRISGNSFVTRTLPVPAKPLERGSYGTAADAHTVGATIWVRATDSTIGNEFSRTPYATGPVGGTVDVDINGNIQINNGVACSNHATGCNVGYDYWASAIVWRPTLDIPGKIYMTGRNIKVAAVDGQAVRQLGSGDITTDFTLDTKPPQTGSSALDIPVASGTVNVGVSRVSAGLKTTTQNVTMTITAPETRCMENGAYQNGTTCDNTTDNQLSYCIESVDNDPATGICGDPDAATLLGNTRTSVANSGEWIKPIAFTDSLAISLLNDQAHKQKVKIAVFDKAANVSTSEKEIVLDAPTEGNPPAPASFTAEDISNATKPLVYLRWDDISASLDLQDAYSGDFAKFRIYRAQGTPPDTNGQPFAELTTASLTNYVDGGVAYDTAYSYALVVEDNVGNRSSPINASPGSITPTSTGLTIPSPPIITAGGYPAQELTTTSAKITWDTDKASDSKVIYAAVPSKPLSFDGYPSQGVSCTAGTTGCATSGTDGHSVRLVGLQPGTRYFYEIRSAVSGNSTPGIKNSEGGTDFQFTTLTPPPVVKPVISEVQVTIYHDRAFFGWTTDLYSDSFVDIGMDASLTLSSSYGRRESTNHHGIFVSSMSPQTTYYFRLNSTAGEGTGVAPSTENPLSGGANFSCSSSSCSFTTAVDPGDDQPPTYDNIQVSNEQYNTATITWTTNEPATSFVEFWKSGDTTHRFWPPAPGSLVVSHSVQLPFDLEPDTDYSWQVISADGSNNSVPSAEQAPFHTLPQPVVVTAPAFTGPTIRHDTITATTATIYFRTDQPTSTIIHYSINDQSYIQPQPFPELVTDHTVTLLNLAPGTTYYYKVEVANSSGLSTESTDCGGSLCYFTTMTSSNPLPLIVEGSLSVTNIAPNVATIGWNTILPGDSFVEFGPADESGNPLYGRTFGYVSDSKTEHTVVLPNDLLSGQTYYFRVRTRDTYSQLVAYPGTVDTSVNTCAPQALDERNPCFTTTVSDQILISELATPPIITGVGALLVTDVKAIIGWSTDKLADSEVNYGLSTSYGTPIKQVDAEDKPIYTRTHAVTLEGLQPSTDYYFKVASTSLLPADLRIEDDKGGAGYTFKTNAGTGRYTQAPGQQGAVKLDTTPPVLSSVIVDKLTNTTATIKWNTNEQSTSVVKFGETADYGRLAGDYSTLTNDHTVVLQKLDSGTEYHFKAYSCDREANCAESYDLTFTTRGTKSEKPKKEEGEEKSEEDEDDTKGKEELDDATKRIQELSKDRKLSVEKIIELLKDFSEEEVSKILSSIGLQLVSPPKFVSGTPRIEVTTTTATINWQTDREADSRVAYVSDADYKSSSDDPYRIEAGDMSNFTTDHEVALIGLEPNTLYHFQVRSREPAGRTARSKDYTLKTLPMKPEITDLKIAETTERTATLTWKTNVPTTSIITYENLRNNAQRSQGDPQFVTIHRFTLQDLEVSSSYQASIRAEDESGLSFISGLFKFSTKRDIVPPEIVQVRTDVTLSPGKSEFAQAIITWRTNEPSTSQVLYEEGITQSQTLKNASPESTEHLLNHVVVLNKLRPATVYRFRVASTDPTVNKAESRDFTLLTPQKKETVLEIIIKNFEDTFGFLKSFGQ